MKLDWRFWLGVWLGLRLAAERGDLEGWGELEDEALERLYEALCYELDVPPPSARDYFPFFGQRPSRSRIGL